MKNNESRRYDRRTFVTALGTAGAIAVAGCADNGEQPDDDTPDPGVDDDEETPTPTPEGEADDGEEENGAEDENDAEDEEQYELRIHVVDSEEEPVEGASIDIEDEGGEDAIDIAEETDEEGQVIVELADGTYTVHIRADGFADAEEDVTIDGADEEILVELQEDDGEEDDGEEEDGEEEETNDEEEG